MKLSQLAAVLRGAGLTVIETSGWAGRGYKGRDLIEIRGVLWHHTATNRARFSADAPTLQMCIEGRPDVAGPLCNIVLGRSGAVYLVAAGLANHAGYGSAAGIPTDTGNYYLIGIEMESSGIAPFDWTADQLRVAPHLGAALERAYLLNLPAELRLQLGHAEYSSEGKIDPAGWPGGMDGLRKEINALLADPERPGQPVPPPTPAPVPAQAASGRLWIVDPGDTLGGIAEYYGLSVASIAALNRIADPNRIEVGHELMIPRGGSRVWTVDPGDTLGGIADHYGVSVASIAAVNGIANPDRITVGQVLQIP